MLKTKQKIAFIALFLCITRTPPLQATQSHTAQPDPDTRNYVNSYLIKVLNLRDISPIVIGYVGDNCKYCTSLLDLIIRLKYHAHAQQMIRKAGKGTALLSSVEEGYLASIKYLHQQGADIDAKDHYRKTSLHLSAVNGHLACVKYLVKQGADIDAKDNCRNTALILRAWGDHLACVKYLVGQGADIHAKNIYGYTALLFSAKRGHLACVQYLVQKGADVNPQNIYGGTALGNSIASGHIEITNYLRAQGAK